MAPTDIRIWRTIRATWMSTALVGVAVASIPSVRFFVVVAATLLAGACALAFMIRSAERDGVPLRRPARIRLSRGATAVTLVVALVLSALAGASFTLVLVFDAPNGLVFPMGAALAGIGGEMLNRLAIRLARRSSNVSEPGSPTVGVV